MARISCHISCSKRLHVQHEVCQLEVRGACNKVLVKLEEGKNLFQITHPGAIKALTRGVPVFMTAFTDACMVWPDRLVRHDGDEWARQETKAASCSTKRVGVYLLYRSISLRSPATWKIANL
ncbi:hypothetical protein PC129_g6259 [Phytophthora cactorum]|uniref:Uncharacterized protein n=1 Tax=Phytophthora cactorum TaxID=29920 RepID=A0A8T1IG38_9STRA|nr:hypothetical protein PC112_g8347 [Phytophthora cactorum]KAG2831270.1 hypothetical protein PC111_g7077 [Phytophthora cactorum]KAG2859461.1 hypothetical protein PC113_g8921 [Phytophthora cactorum]KAG2912950.1 hypothetical protein PC114_g8720 [Phytophthora cactorum]KAG2927770.1 hypothetical protein PC115_g7435 [Phytophthora cactorum]